MMIGRRSNPIERRPRTPKPSITSLSYSGIVIAVASLIGVGAGWGSTRPSSKLDPDRFASPPGSWPYRAVERPALPATKHNDWVRNQIDTFVLAKLEQAGLGPA